MKIPATLSAVALFVLALAAPTSAPALTDAEAVAGRALSKRYADAIVGVEMVVTLKGMQGDRPLPPREQKREINGTMVSAGGVTVLSLASIDPRGSIPAAMQTQIRFDEPEFKEVKLRLADGAEIPARVVLKDADLDLAVIAPVPGSAPAGPLPFVDLADRAEPAVLGTYYDISRAPKLQQRVPAVRLVYVTGMIEKPRRFLLASDYSPGCPTFDAAGRVLGIALRHVAGGQSSGLVILPAEDVAEIAREAAAIKPEAEAPKAP